MNNAFVLAFSMWFTAEFQIFVVMTFLKLAQVSTARVHKDDASESSIFCCPNCEYRTICKRYLEDHTKLKHTQSGNGQFICTQGSCFQKPTTYPNQAYLNKHRTCHQQQACKVCGKNLGSSRSLRRHEKSRHVKEPIDKSQGKKNANGRKIRQNPLANMAPKSPNASNIPSHKSQLWYQLWCRVLEYSEYWVLRNAEKRIVCYEIKLDFNMIYQSLRAPE